MLSDTAVLVSRGMYQTLMLMVARQGLELMPT
jgi:hypothetical protein